MTIMMRSSGIPIPNINSSCGERDPLVSTFFKPEQIGYRFQVQGFRGSRFKGFKKRLSSFNLEPGTFNSEPRTQLVTP
jgi:hypothetical protein